MTNKKRIFEKEKSRIQVRIDSDVHKELKDFAKETGIELYPMINRALRRNLITNRKIFLPWKEINHDL